MLTAAILACKLLYIVTNKVRQINNDSFSPGKETDYVNMRGCSFLTFTYISSADDNSMAKESQNINSAIKRHKFPFIPGI